MIKKRTPVNLNIIDRGITAHDAVMPGELAAILAISGHAPSFNWSAWSSYVSKILNAAYKKMSDDLAKDLLGG
jgi:hypothetical protein